MTIYSYKIGSNQYQKRVKTPTFGPILATVTGLGLLASVILPIGPDKNTQFLQQFSFGEFPKVAMAFEPNIAGTSAMIVKNSPVTKEEIVLATDHPKEIDHIWLKESSRGKNKVKGGLQDICEEQGKSNEFGYGGMAMKICFNSFEESVQVVNDWLNKRTNESLCFYNIGVKTPDCTYIK